MRKILITLILIFSSFASYCQHPYIQKLKTIAQITFPDKPTINPISPDTIYACEDKQGDIYIAQSSGIDQGAMKTLYNNSLDALYNGIMIGSIGPADGKAFYKSHINLQGIDGFEFACKRYTNGKILYNYEQLFYINGALIYCTCLCPDSVSPNNYRINNFLSTLKINIRTDQIGQKNISNLGFIAGHISAIVATFGIIAAIIFLVVFLVKRPNNKKIK
jgi:hypothetical protein